MKQKRARPCSVTLLAICVLIIAIINLIRFAQTIIQWDFIRQIIDVSPIYLLVSGVFWGVLGVGLAFSIWRGWKIALRGMIFGVIGYLFYQWIDRLWIVHSHLDNWIFLLVMDLIYIFIVAYILSRKNVKVFFGEKNG